MKQDLLFLKRKKKKENIKLGDEILEFIAENIKTNIRDLEGAYKTSLY